MNPRLTSHGTAPLSQPALSETEFRELAALDSCFVAGDCNSSDFSLDGLRSRLES